MASPIRRYRRMVLQSVCCTRPCGCIGSSMAWRLQPWSSRTCTARTTISMKLGTWCRWSSLAIVMLPEQGRPVSRIGALAEPSEIGCMWAMLPEPSSLQQKVRRSLSATARPSTSEAAQATPSVSCARSAKSFRDSAARSCGTNPNPTALPGGIATSLVRKNCWDLALRCRWRRVSDAQSIGTGSISPPMLLAHRERGVSSGYCDITRAKDLLGCSAEVSLEEGLRRTIDWYRDYIAPNGAGTA
mmetsp:Transcript_126174/g.403826  ORF Transcript_126174/g.403826 Transcript_126174/m.403826 type:complete len:244 (+) Transcript_126174:523-1254(+)